MVLINNDNTFIEIYKEGNIHKILWDKQRGTLQIDVGNSIVRIGADDVEKTMEEFVQEVVAYAQYGNKSSNIKTVKTNK